MSTLILASLVGMVDEVRTPDGAGAGRQALQRSIAQLSPATVAETLTDAVEALADQAAELAWQTGRTISGDQIRTSETTVDESEFERAAARQQVLDARRALHLHPHGESIKPWLDLLDAAFDEIDYRVSQLMVGAVIGFVLDRVPAVTEPAPEPAAATPA